MIAAVCFAAVVAAQAQGGSELPRLAALRVTDAIAVDGRLDEACWRTAPVASDFHVLAAKKRAPAAAAETRCQVVFDDAALAIGVVCREPRLDDLIAKASERDGAIWLDDSIELFLQPGPDCYYHFGVNNRGVLYDARIEVLADGRAGDLAQGRLWDGVWEAAVGRTADAWTVEVRVPLAALDLQPQTPPAWRFNVGRTAARRLEYSAWAPVVKGFHDLACFGFLDTVGMDVSRFVVDGTGLTFPPLCVGQNRVQFALPVRRPGQFGVSSVLRTWAADAALPPFPPGAAVAAVQGLLPVTLSLPVSQGDVLHEAALAITDAATGTPLLLRAHLFKAPTPFDAALDWAVYYPTDTAVAVAVTLAVAPESARGLLSARLLGAGAGLPRQAEVRIEQPGPCRLPLPLAGLPGGFYRIAVSADLTGLGRFTKELRFYLTTGPFD